ncbi:MAG: cytochrome c biogenesis protein CcdA [Clostridiales bacterium]|jgi:cytochrome c-type biogenesis protein|nr:cytochrome c biogenesis protein CcdA [Clostridiales bacterium]
MEGLLSFITVFFQGVASFLSPCVLPLIPAYLTYMTGQSIEIMMEDKRAHRKLIINALAFIFGFSLVFVLLGIVATSIGRFLQANRDIIRKISGILIIFFGLFHTGFIPIKFLNYEKRLNIGRSRPGLISSFLIGVGFSFGWSPCIGPVLTTVFIMASQAETLLIGMSLLIVYAIGLGLPFLLIAVGLKFFWKYIQGLYKHMQLIKIISGVLLIVIGLMIYFNAFYFLTGL